ncbi:cation-transporting P-type ATPase [Rhodococcus aetherivorans]|uniref:cation-translocating P-type ATPase n=1 Tax=Rhodococcus TaxID=1827 RepID=UPI002041B02C|nr:MULTISPECIES: cation-transporting P-type ATPase [Rhodococcus]USC15199.1 cation-transporting P-type ATPase [Rhodococcus sp. 11-3]WKW98568.1 cation-transporting P-type ATPase [Rhodococcus aetherivorans]
MQADSGARLLDSDGLTGREAAARLRRDGPNQLPAARRVPWWRRLIAQLTHFFALLLWFASALAFVAGMPELGIAVIVVIVVNGIFAFVQQERAEKAAERLGELLPTTIVVRRDGAVRTVDARDLVVGDVVVLTGGDRVPADLTLAVAGRCTFDESTLTGESEPVLRTAGAAVFAGTFVAEGESEGIVTATGANTRLAGIAALTTSVRRPPGPLDLEIQRIVRTLAFGSVGVGAVFFAVSLLVGISWQDAFLFAVGITVALVPEGLLPTVTLSLAMGAQRMARDNALVRNLEAVETLGSTTFICTDKTGTLTQNQMNVVEAWTPAGTVAVRGEGYAPTGEVTGPEPAVAAAATAGLAGAAASKGGITLDDDEWRAVGDPMEAAIAAFAARLAGPGAQPGPVTRRFVFDPRRRRESVIVGGQLLLKGAPDAVLPRCADPGELVDRAEEALADMASRGLRVLAVARRTLTDPGVETDPDLAERDLELLGLLGMEDPPRTAVPAALRAARGAGIKVAMLTGDHPETARAIAREIGLLGPAGLVVQGKDLPEDDQLLGALLDRDGIVISRVSPEQKLRVAKALQDRGHVVAMTGDGVNDGPALRQADIGVAMGEGGTDVAREAADLVLLDDDFATILTAVEQGRATYANIRRFLSYHLTSNVAELTPFALWGLSGGQFPLALGVLQILCIDIGTDLLPALALGGEPPSRDTLKRPPERRHLVDGTLLVRVFGVLGPTEAIVEMSAFLVALLVAGWRPGGEFPTGAALLAASGAAFTAVVLGQVGAAFACRSATRPPWQLGWGSNRLLLWAVLAELVALVVFLGVGPVADVLGHAVPPLEALGVALLGIPAVLVVDSVYKRVRRRWQ